ncbi:MAG: hypothetical protein QOD91_1132, partial [Frankiales bacterium]|nr:hypothetical protein [Frankiales bacterium]
LQTTGEYVVRLHVSGRTRLSVTLWSGGKAASQLLYNAHAFRVPAGEHTVHVTSIGAAIDTVDVNFTTVTRTCITSGDVSQVDPL